MKPMELREKSLNEIYGWEPMQPASDTYVLRTAERAMRLPLKDLSPEEIRLLIGQKTGLAYLLPLAIAILRRNPMTQTALFPGDLLEVCKRLSPSDWGENPAEYRAFQEILQASSPKTVTAFETPCGLLTLTDANGERLPFQVQQMIWDLDVSVFDSITQKNVPLESPHQYTLTVPVHSLTMDSDYLLRLNGDCPCRYGDSDECAVASLVTGENVTLSLGAEDLNDAEKDRQAVPISENGVQIGLQAPAQYDERKFRNYVVFPLVDWSGYRFRLLDRDFSEIRFRLAWAEHSLPDVEPAEYSAVTNWTIM